MTLRAMCSVPLRATGCVLAVMLCVTAAAAEGKETDAKITIELNSLQGNPKGCALTFVIHNGLGGDIDKMAYETALFDAQGLVSRLMVLDFGSLPAGKTRVMRFGLAVADCASTARILINDAAVCTGKGIEPDDCIARLRTANRSAIAFGK